MKHVILTHEGRAIALIGYVQGVPQLLAKGKHFNTAPAAMAAELAWYSPRPIRSRRRMVHGIRAILEKGRDPRIDMGQPLDGLAGVAIALGLPPRVPLDAEPEYWKEFCSRALKALNRGAILRQYATVWELDYATAY